MLNIFLPSDCVEKLPKELSKQFCLHPSLLVKLLERLGSSDDAQVKHIEYVLIQSGMTENCKCKLPDDTFCRLVSKAPCYSIIQALFMLCSLNEEFVAQQSMQLTEQLVLIKYIIKESAWSDKVLHSICSEILPKEIDTSKIVIDSILVQKLLDHNCDPSVNAASKKKPLLIVANKVFTSAKRPRQFQQLGEIICLLLEVGADVEDLCSLEHGKQTSSLHMATELALRMLYGVVG